MSFQDTRKTRNRSRSRNNDRIFYNGNNKDSSTNNQSHYPAKTDTKPHSLQRDHHEQRDEPTLTAREQASLIMKHLADRGRPQTPESRPNSSSLNNSIQRHPSNISGSHNTLVRPPQQPNFISPDISSNTPHGPSPLLPVPSFKTLPFPHTARASSSAGAKPISPGERLPTSNKSKRSASANTLLKEHGNSHHFENLFATQDSRLLSTSPTSRTPYDLKYSVLPEDYQRSTMFQNNIYSSPTPIANMMTGTIDEQMQKSVQNVNNSFYLTQQDNFIPRSAPSIPPPPPRSQPRSQPAQSISPLPPPANRLAIGAPLQHSQQHKGPIPITQSQTADTVPLLMQSLVPSLQLTSQLLLLAQQHHQLQQSQSAIDNQSSPVRNLNSTFPQATYFNQPQILHLVPDSPLPSPAIEPSQRTMTPLYTSRRPMSASPPPPMRTERPIPIVRKVRALSPPAAQSVPLRQSAATTRQNRSTPRSVGRRVSRSPSTKRSRSGDTRSRIPSHQILSSQPTPPARPQIQRRLNNSSRLPNNSQFIITPRRLEQFQPRKVKRSPPLRPHARGTAGDRAGQARKVLRPISHGQKTCSPPPATALNASIKYYLPGTLSEMLSSSSPVLLSRSQPTKDLNLFARGDRLSAAHLSARSGNIDDYMMSPVTDRTSHNALINNKLMNPPPIGKHDKNKISDENLKQNLIKAVNTVGLESGDDAEEEEISRETLKFYSSHRGRSSFTSSLKNLNLSGEGKLHSLSLQDNTHRHQQSPHSTQAISTNALSLSFKEHLCDQIPSVATTLGTGNNNLSKRRPNSNETNQYHARQKSAGNRSELNGNPSTSNSHYHQQQQQQQMKKQTSKNITTNSTINNNAFEEMMELYSRPASNNGRPPSPEAARSMMSATNPPSPLVTFRSTPQALDDGAVGNYVEVDIHDENRTANNNILFTSQAVLLQGTSNSPSSTYQFRTSSNHPLIQNNKDSTNNEIDCNPYQIKDEILQFARKEKNNSLSFPTHDLNQSQSPLPPFQRQKQLAPEKFVSSVRAPPQIVTSSVLSEGNPSDADKDAASSSCLTFSAVPSSISSNLIQHQYSNRNYSSNTKGGLIVNRNVVNRSHTEEKTDQRTAVLSSKLENYKQILNQELTKFNRFNNQQQEKEKLVQAQQNSATSYESGEKQYKQEKHHQQKQHSPMPVECTLVNHVSESYRVCAVAPSSSSVSLIDSTYQQEDPAAVVFKRRRNSNLVPEVEPIPRDSYDPAIQTRIDTSSHSHNMRNSADLTFYDHRTSHSNDSKTTYVNGKIMDPQVNPPSSFGGKLKSNNVITSSSSSLAVEAREDDDNGEILAFTLNKKKTHFSSVADENEEEMQLRNPYDGHDDINIAHNQQNYQAYYDHTNKHFVNNNKPISITPSDLLYNSNSLLNSNYSFDSGLNLRINEHGDLLRSQVKEMKELYQSLKQEIRALKEKASSTAI